MSDDEFSDSEVTDDDESSDEVEKALSNKSRTGINPEARRKLEEYYERKSLEQNLEDDLFFDDDYE